MNKNTLVKLVLLFQCLYMRAQDSEWNTSSSKDGKVEVKYRFTYQLDSNAKKILIIEDLDEYFETISFQNVFH